MERSRLFVVYWHVGGHFLQNTWLLIAVGLSLQKIGGHLRSLKIGVHNEKLFHTTLTLFKIKMARAALTILARARPQIISFSRWCGESGKLQSRPSKTNGDLKTPSRDGNCPRPVVPRFELGWEEN